MSTTDVCDLCTPTTNTILWQDDFCRVVLLYDVDYPAYCRLELLSHVKEMTDLPPPERARVMKAVFAVELAIREVLHPDKINLASLGNKTPHIHWHVIPRFVNDKHFPNSHWGEAVRDDKTVELSTENIEVLTQKIKAHIECAMNATVT
ncbi:MAG: HIT family protein [Methylotenera sp.]|nr:HIT family protein [Methylotenera sp.]